MAKPPQIFLKILKYARILTIFRNYRPQKILDVGCGNGDFSITLARTSRTDEVYGVDISFEKLLSAEHKGVMCVNVDVDKLSLPFKDSSFDAVFCGEIIEHLFDPDRLLDNMYRVLRKEGICVITTPNLASWINRIVLLLGFQPYYTNVSLRYNVGKIFVRGNCRDTHVRVSVKRALCDLLECHSLRIRKVFGGSYNGLPFPIDLLDRIISRVSSSLSSAIIVVVQK